MKADIKKYICIPMRSFKNIHLNVSVQVQYQFIPAAERSFSPRAVVRSAGGRQRGGQLPAGGATVRATEVSRGPHKMRTLQRGEKVKHALTIHNLGKIFHSIF